MQFLARFCGRNGGFDKCEFILFPLFHGTNFTGMVEVVILLVIILVVLCVIADRVTRGNRLLKELLAKNTTRQGTPFEEEPLPPPLTLDDDDRR